MKEYDRIIFVGRTGACREVMAAGILRDLTLNHPVEILARGLVVLFPEPLNQKAEAVLISNGIDTKNYTSVKLAEEDLTENTLVLALESAQISQILSEYPDVPEENIHVLTEFVGDELEIMDPYGGPLTAYGLCYETLRKTIKKLVIKLNGGE